MKMGRNLNEVITGLPPARQERIEARYREMKDEVEGLRELREVAGRAQAEIAGALRIKQPSVSKIENQTDMYLSTLRNYIEAIGGELELVVRLPKHKPLRIRRLGDVIKPSSRRLTRRAPAPLTKRTTKARTAKAI